MSTSDSRDSGRIADELSLLPLLKGVDERQRLALTEAAVLIKLKKRAPLFEEGQAPRYFKLVARGQVELLKLAGGKRKLLGLVRPGEMVCYASIILGSPYQYSAFAHADASIVAVERACMLDLIQQGGLLASRLLEGMGKRIRAIRQASDDAAPRSSKARLAGYLLQFAPCMDTPGFELCLPCSKQDAASQLNLSKEAFSRALGELRAAGVIEVRGRILTVLDRRALVEARQTLSNTVASTARSATPPASRPLN